MRDWDDEKVLIVPPEWSQTRPPVPVVPGEHRPMHRVSGWDEPRPNDGGKWWFAAGVLIVCGYLVAMAILLANQAPPVGPDGITTVQVEPTPYPTPCPSMGGVLCYHP